MTLKQLTTFYWVHRLGGFAMAAEYLHSTQSAVSMRVQELEASLGVELFDRSQRTARLTPKGRQLIPYVEQIISTTAEIQHQIANPESLSGAIGLGVTELVAITWLPQLVSAIHRKCPRVVLKLNVDSAHNHIRKLQSGEIDVAIVPGPIEGGRYTQHGVGSVDFVWVASDRHDIPPGTLSPRDLQHFPLLTLAAESLSYKTVDRWFEENGAVVERLDVCNSLGVLAALARAGTGIAYLPSARHHTKLIDPSLRILDVSPRLPSLDYYVVHDARAAQAAVHIISDLARSVSTFPVPAAQRAQTQIATGLAIHEPS